MQVVIPKVTEVGKAQQVREQQHTFQQQYGAVQLQQQADRKLNQVQKSEKSEGKRIKEEENRKNRHGSQEKNKHENQEKEQSKMAVDTYRGRNIDIKM